jgi:hypothetical protein
MNYTILNLTDSNRSDSPQDGDFIQYTYSNGNVLKKHYKSAPDETQEDIDNLARLWRNDELAGTDHIVPLTDHPDHAATLAYRVALRDWPSTSDFPDTKPTL